MAAIITTYTGLQSAVAAWLARDGDVFITQSFDDGGFAATGRTLDLEWDARPTVEAGSEPHGPHHPFHLVNS